MLEFIAIRKCLHIWTFSKSGHISVAVSTCWRLMLSTKEIPIKCYCYLDMDGFQDLSIKREKERKQSKIKPKSNLEMSLMFLKELILFSETAVSPQLWYCLHCVCDNSSRWYASSISPGLSDDMHCYHWNLCMFWYSLIGTSNFRSWPMSFPHALPGNISLLSLSLPSASASFPSLISFNN